MLELDKFKMDGETIEVVDRKAREELEDLPDIPTKTSQLQNDSGFITSANIPTKTSQLQNDSGFITSASVPTKTSQLQNDSGFITSASVPTKTSELTNDSGFITSSSRNAVINSGIIRVEIPTSDGTKYSYHGSKSNAYNMNVAYGGGNLADFSISIPSNIQPPTGFYEVNLTASCADTIVIPVLKSATKTAITGWLWTPANAASKTVGIQLSALGY